MIRKLGFSFVGFIILGAGIAACSIFCFKQTQYLPASGLKVEHGLDWRVPDAYRSHLDDTSSLILRGSWIYRAATVQITLNPKQNSTSAEELVEMRLDALGNQGRNLSRRVPVDVVMTRHFTHTLGEAIEVDVVYPYFVDNIQTGTAEDVLVIIDRGDSFVEAKLSTDGLTWLSKQGFRRILNTLAVESANDGG